MAKDTSPVTDVELANYAPEPAPRPVWSAAIGNPAPLGLLAVCIAPPPQRASSRRAPASAPAAASRRRLRRRLWPLERPEGSPYPAPPSTLPAPSSSA